MKAETVKPQVVREDDVAMVGPGHDDEHYISVPIKSLYEIEDVAWVVPHQANLRIIQAVGSALGIPEEKIVVNIERYGNTGSASVPLALWEASRAGRIRSGDLVLLTSFGAGFHWAALLLRF